LDGAGAGLLRLEFAQPPRTGVLVRVVHSAALERAGVAFLAAPWIEGDHRWRAREAHVQLVGHPVSWTIEPAARRHDAEDDRSPEEAPAPEPILRAEGSFQSFLDGVAHAQRAEVRLSSEGRVAAVETLLVDPWCWPWFTSTIAALPVLVLANDGVVRLLTAGLRSMETTGRPARPSEPSRATALFERLRDESEIRYAEPSAERAPNGVSLQRIRPPHRVIADLARRRGEGNCLDLSLLFAGCLESIGEAPLIVFLLDESALPTHALVGWWADGAQRFRPIVGGDQLRRWIREGRVRLIETTRVCCGRVASTEEAEREADRLVRETARVVAVDILAVRPPYGIVSTLDATFDSIVLAAVRISEASIASLGTPTIETLHLFYGTLVAEGPTGTLLLAEAGVPRERLLDACRAEIARRARPGPSGRTRGYERCIADARASARSQGSTVVRESDLWWALLTCRGSSLDGILRSEPSTRANLISALAAIAPSARPGSTMA